MRLKFLSKGFTLLEVLLVILILSAVFFPLLQVLSSGLVLSEEVKGSNAAAILAQKKLEEIKATSFITISSESKASVPNYPEYSRRVIVSQPSLNLKDIMVIVYWMPGQGAETNVSVESLIANF